MVTSLIPLGKPFQTAKTTNIALQREKLMRPLAMLLVKTFLLVMTQNTTTGPQMEKLMRPLVTLSAPLSLSVETVNTDTQIPK